MIVDEVLTDTVLVVDDDPETCQLLSVLLNDGGIRVETALDGYEGIEKAKAHDPALIVLDVMMPGMDGWETYTQLKSISNIPVLFLSAKCDLDSVAHGLDLGADDYVCKPFSVVDLKSRVSNLLEVPLVGGRVVEEGKYVDPITRPSVGKYEEPATRPSINLKPPSLLYYLLKRVIDIGISVSTLLLLAPILFICGFLIKLESSGPVIYRQKRVGLKEKTWGKSREVSLVEFDFYKLRTMRNDANSDVHRDYVQAFILGDEHKMQSIQGKESNTRKLVDDQRVTRIGKFLRRSSLDEIPQLFNVIKGEMSLVGPRPALSYETEVYEIWHRKRLMVKPGVTGLWQVTARSSAEFDEMVRMDIWYIQHRSLLLDLKILLKTPFAVLTTKGAI
jgi:lipopolysaccharide/colanic/teichoic acid biosynthesis glycosyltransferase